MPEDKYRHFLCAIVANTKIYAREAIKEYVKAKGTDSEDYKTGYMMGFHRFITLIQQDADAFDIKLEEIGLADFNEEEFYK